MNPEDAENTEPAPTESDSRPGISDVWWRDDPLGKPRSPASYIFAPLLFVQGTKPTL